MRRWKPKRAPGLWIGLVLLCCVLLGVGFIGSRLVAHLVRAPEQWDISLQLYGELVALIALLLVAGLLVYRVAAALTLTYELDRNGLYIVWIGNRVVVPLMEIDHLDSGAEHMVLPRHMLQGIGYYSGTVHSEGSTTPVHLFTTQTPAQSLLISTSNAAYAICPDDQDDFVQHLEQRRKLGATKTLRTTVEPGRFLFYDFWGDSVVRWALLAAFGINLLLLGVLVISYPHLGDVVATHFDATGKVTAFRPRHQMLFLPLAACFVGLVNTTLGLLLYRHSRTGVYMLQAASVLAQVLFGVAILLLILRS